MLDGKSFDGADAGLTEDGIGGYFHRNRPWKNHPF